MAITATDWSRRVNIQGTPPVATLSGFVALITGANLPAEVWSTAKNGGGDLRACTDKDGFFELPIEVVTFDTVAQEAILFVRFDSYESAAAGLWLFYGNTGAITYDVAASYGRNAVWSDFEYVFHFSRGKRTDDSTGNYHLLESGEISEVDDQIGDGGAGVGYNNNNKMHVNGFNGALGGSARTHTMWVRIGDGNYGILDYGVNATGQRYTVRVESSRLRLEVQGGYKRSSAVIADAVFHMISIKNSGAGTFPTNTTFHIDGVEPSYVEAGSTALNTNAYGDNYLIFANEKQSTRPSNEHGEQWLRLFEVSDEQIELEYLNQSSPGTFWTAGTPENTSAGATDEFNFDSALPAQVDANASHTKHCYTAAGFWMTAAHDLQGYRSNSFYSGVDTAAGGDSSAYAMRYFDGAVLMQHSVTSALSKVAAEMYSFAFTQEGQVGLNALATKSSQHSAGLPLSLLSDGSADKSAAYSSALPTSLDRTGEGLKSAIYSSNLPISLDFSGTYVKSASLYGSISSPVHVAASVSKDNVEFYTFSTALPGEIGLTASSMKAGELTAVQPVSADKSAVAHKHGELTATVAVLVDTLANQQKLSQLQATVTTLSNIFVQSEKAGILLSGLVVNVSSAASADKTGQLDASFGVGLSTPSMFHDPATRIDYFTARLDGRIAATRVNGQIAAVRINGGGITTRIDGVLKL